MKSPAVRLLLVYTAALAIGIVWSEAHLHYALPYPWHSPAGPTQEEWAAITADPIALAAWQVELESSWVHFHRYFFALDMLELGWSATLFTAPLLLALTAIKRVRGLVSKHRRLALLAAPAVGLAYTTRYYLHHTTDALTFFVSFVTAATPVLLLQFLLSRLALRTVLAKPQEPQVLTRVADQPEQVRSRVATEQPEVEEELEENEIPRSKARRQALPG